MGRGRALLNQLAFDGAQPQQEKSTDVHKPLFVPAGSDSLEVSSFGLEIGAGNEVQQVNVLKLRLRMHMMADNGNFVAGHWPADERRRAAKFIRLSSRCHGPFLEGTGRCLQAGGELLRNLTMIFSTMSKLIFSPM